MSAVDELVDALAAVIEQASPEQRARLRAALDVDQADPSDAVDRPAVYTPATLAAELGRTPRSIRGAIARGELEAVKRGRGWVIGADAVERWAAATARRPAGPRPRGRSGDGPMARALRRS